MKQIDQQSQDTHAVVKSRRAKEVAEAKKAAAAQAAAAI